MPAGQRPPEGVERLRRSPVEVVAAPSVPPLAGGRAGAVRRGAVGREVAVARRRRVVHVAIALVWIEVAVVVERRAVRRCARDRPACWLSAIRRTAASIRLPGTLMLENKGLSARSIGVAAITPATLAPSAASAPGTCIATASRFGCCCRRACSPSLGIGLGRYSAAVLCRYACVPRGPLTRTLIR